MHYAVNESLLASVRMLTAAYFENAVGYCRPSEPSPILCEFRAEVGLTAGCVCVVK